MLLLKAAVLAVMVVVVFAVIDFVAEATAAVLGPVMFISIIGALFVLLHKVARSWN